MLFRFSPRDAGVWPPTWLPLADAGSGFTGSCRCTIFTDLDLRVDRVGADRSMLPFRRGCQKSIRLELLAAEDHLVERRGCRESAENSAQQATARELASVVSGGLDLVRRWVLVPVNQAAPHFVDFAQLPGESRTLACFIGQEVGSVHTKPVAQIPMARILAVRQPQRLKSNREIQHCVGGIPISPARKEVADPLASYPSKEAVQG